MTVQNIFDGSSKPKWYIVQTYVGFEDVVKKMISQRVSNLGMNDRVREVYIPTKSITKLNSKNERVEKEEKVYPGYIYISMILDKEVGYLIQNTQYVSKIAGTGDLAIPLEDGYVENLKKTLAEKEDTTEVKTKNDYNMGDLVKVLEGPFKDMQGKVNGIDKDSNKLTILLNIFDRETEVDLDILEVAPALD